MREINLLKWNPVDSLIAPCLVGAVTLFAGIGLGQNGLRDIPSTRVEDQLAGFKLPEGAEINLFAAEPMLTKPVHMNWDSQGRLWVVSSPLYPHIKPGQEEIDQVVILEDTDGDGAADKSTVFADQLHIPTAVLPGDGGAYVANSTEMLFLKDTDGDGKADQRRVVLSGFGTEDTHHLIHTFRWGPEGMIWMNQSIYIHTHLETPYGVRRLLGGGMWYFRPETHRAEVYMKGLINPWGHVFDKWGQSFMTDGAGSEGINFVYPKSVFRTSPGAPRFVSGLNPGQPKHCGAEVISGNHVPESYRGTIAAPDFRGHRVNRFRLGENGTSGYLSTQEEDLVSNTHRAFRPIDVKMGPDGAIYIGDWYNPIIQHGEVDFRDERRDHEHGRIWRVSFPGRKLDEAADFDGMNEEQLALLAGPVGWYEQMATVELRKRDADKALAGIRSAWDEAPDDDGGLRQLYLIQASQAINRFQEDWCIDLARNATDPQVRAGALRALYYHAPSVPEAITVAATAVSDSHPRVRLFGVSVFSELPHPETVQLALKALEGIDEPDDFLDFAVWNVCREHSHKWLPLAAEKNPFASPGQLLYAMRALNTDTGSDVIMSAFRDGKFDGEEDLRNFSDWVARKGSQSVLDDFYDRALAGETSPRQRAIMLEALANAARLRKMIPGGNREGIVELLTSGDANTFRQAAFLAGGWKVGPAREALEKAFLGSDYARSMAALEGLRAFGGQETGAFLSGLARDGKASPQQRAKAIRGLASFQPGAAARLAVQVLTNFEDTSAAEGIFAAFLANRNATTHLTNALSGKGVTIPEPIALIGVQKASSAATNPQQLVAAIQKAGGLKPMKMSLTTAEMEEMMERVATKGDPHRGETVYRRASLQCIVCHAIGGAGGIIGPDMVSIGASAPVDYLIESLLEPSKKIKEGYHTVLVTMKNGDTFAGAIAGESNDELVIRDAAGNENRLAKGEIKSRTVSPISLMPPGLTLQLREDEFVDLVRFLSELGKEGEFKTTANAYIRKWEVLSPHERTRDDIGHYGEKIFAEDFEGYQWSQAFAKVDGSVPLGELPDVVGRGRNRYGVGRFHIKAAEPGTIKLAVDGKQKDLKLFLNETEIPLPGEGSRTEVSVKVPEAGDHRITFSGLKGWGLDDVRVEVLEGDGITVAP